MTLNFILDLILPKLCFGCQKPGSYLCSSCENVISKTTTTLCPICEKPSPYGFTHQKCAPKHPIDGMIVLGDYSGLLKKLIHELKYKHVYTLSETLINLVIKHISFDFQKFDFITPIPLHPKRLQKRGYNQAAELGLSLSRKMPLPFFDNVLLKTRNTKPQMSLVDTNERKKNMKGVFKINKRINITGKTIILVDDVSTTGATIFEAAKVLKENGAKSVWGLVLARKKPRGY